MSDFENGSNNQETLLEAPDLAMQLAQKILEDRTRNGSDKNVRIDMIFSYLEEAGILRPGKLSANSVSRKIAGATGQEEEAKGIPTKAWKEAIKIVESKTFLLRDVESIAKEFAPLFSKPWKDETLFFGQPYEVLKDNGENFDIKYLDRIRAVIPELNMFAVYFADGHTSEFNTATLTVITADGQKYHVSGKGTVFDLLDDIKAEYFEDKPNDLAQAA